MGMLLLLLHVVTRQMCFYCITLLLGYRVWAYADPIGAILISIYIMGSWFVTGWGECSYHYSLNSEDGVQGYIGRAMYIGEKLCRTLAAFGYADYVHLFVLYLSINSFSVPPCSNSLS